MNEEEVGLVESELPPEHNATSPFLEQERAIEREMYKIMTTQVKLAIVQAALAALGILTALIIAALH